MTNLPVGLMWISGLSSANCAGMIGLITCSIRSGRMTVSRSMPSWCWVLMSTLFSRTGRPFSYSTLTWVLPSGRRYGMAPLLRTSVRRSLRRWASQMGMGIRSGVSSQA